jgi:hypothetical protein
MDFSSQNGKYLLIKKLYALVDHLCVYNYQGELVLYCRQKQLKLKSHIHVFTDETQTREVMNIQQKYSNSSSTVYEVFDNKKKKIGGLWRKNKNTMKLDQWEVYNKQDNSLGILSETSRTQALLRKFLSDYRPTENSILTVANDIIATYQQTFNPFCYELIVKYESNKYRDFDHRLGIMAAIVLAFQPKIIS